MKVIGIDPGSQRTGWGIVEGQGNRLSLVECGVIRTVSGKAAFSVRLAKIYHDLSVPVQNFKPGSAAIEQVFTAQNPQSALKLGQARGVAVAVCAANGLDIFDYEPTLIKKSLVGQGRADKEQVAFMVCKLLNIGDKCLALDTTDALAVAICHLTQSRLAALIGR